MAAFRQAILNKPDNYQPTTELMRRVRKARSSGVDATTFRLPRSKSIFPFAKIGINLERRKKMATSVKDMMDVANAAVPRISPVQAREMISSLAPAPAKCAALQR